MTTLTVLFTDLVGSSELMGKLGPERFDELLAEHDELIDSALAAHGGARVKHTGDGAMAVFTGATEALNGAVAIQQAVERRNRRAETAFSVRVGLSVGDLSEKGGDYFGTPAVEAARLCALAEGDQILAAEIVKVLAGARGEHTFTPLGNLDLKGLARLATVEVFWEHAVEPARVPLPAAFTRDDRVGMIGRDAQLERLVDNWTKATRGELRVVMLSGEPGIGKTRLATELARRAHAQGAAVLLGRCEDGFGAPYKPFAEVVAGAMALDPSELNEWAGHHGAIVSSISRAVRERLPQIGAPDHADPDTTRVRTCEGVAALLSAICDTGPVLVVLDDIHWADEASLLLLRHLARAEPSLPLMLLGTYRDAEAASLLNDTLADMRRATEIVQLPIAGLSDADIRMLVIELSDDAPDAAMIDRVRADTDGNPFFVREAVAHYEESGEFGASEGVRQLIGQRLRRLSEPTQRLLGVAAVIGREFDLDLLAAVAADGDDDVLLDRLDDARATGLVAERAGYVGRFGFSHALVRASLIDGLGATRRVRLHQRIGEAIEATHAGDLDAHVAELAYHFGEATAAVPHQAARYAVLAGKRARLAGSNAEAQAALERALEFLDGSQQPDDILRFDALLELAWAIGEGPDPTRGAAPMEAALALARRLGEPERLVQVANLFPDFLSWGVVIPGVDAILDEATAATAPDDFATRAMLLATRAAATIYSNPTVAEIRVAEDQARDAVSLAQRAGDAASRFCTSLALHETIWPGPDAMAALATAQENLDAARQLGSLPAAAWSEWRVARAHLRFGDRARYDALVESDDRRFVDQATRQLHQAAVAISEGRWDDARRESDDALACLPKNPTIVLAHFEQHSRIRSEQGRTNASLLVRLGETHPQFPALQVDAALATAEADEPETAAVMLGRLAGDGFAIVPHDFGRTLVLRQLSELVADVGTDEHATALHAMLTPYDGQILLAYVGSSIEGAAARGLGQLETVLGRYDDAEAHYEAALALEERIRARACIVRTKLWYARMLSMRDATGDADRAGALLDIVIAEASELGMTAIEAQARAPR